MPLSSKKTNVFISPSNTATPTITGLDDGTYLVQLKVTDEEYLSDLDTVSIFIGLTNNPSLQSKNIENFYSYSSQPDCQLGKSFDKGL